MKSILNFVRMDFYSVKQFRLPIILMASMAAVVGLLSMSPPLMAVILMLEMPLASTYSFTVAENNQLGMLYSTLPLTRRDVVGGRFAFALAVLVLTCIFSLGGGLLIKLIFSTTTSLGTMCFATLAAATFFLLIVSIAYPLCFRFGYSKAQLFIYSPFLLIYPLLAAVQFIAEWRGIELDSSATIQSLGQTPPILGLIALAIGLLILGSSYLISCRLYERFNQGVKR